MLTNSEVARRFADWHWSGAARHLYISGNSIYSYGHHFCVARRFGDVMLFTMRTWGPTTARHKRDVLNALRGCKVIDVPDPDKGTEWNMAQYDEKIDALRGRIARARSRRGRLEGELHILDSEKADYMRLFNIDNYKQSFDL